MEINILNILVLVAVALVVGIILSRSYLELIKKEELKVEYEKTFKKEGDIIIEPLDWEKYLFKKYILRRKDVLLPIEEQILEKKWENMNKKYPRRNRRKKLRN